MKSGIKNVSRLCLVVLITLLQGLAVASQSEKSVSPPQALLDGETWEGVWAGDESRYAVFRGIPYAAPPVGDRRWQPPMSRTPEPGVHMARANGPACIQTQRLVAWDRSIHRAFALNESSVPDLMNISEDCLYLNIWTPAPGKDKKLPVMVWIYGGSNRSGWAHQSYYDGASMVKRGVVSVFINYRVGVFGWMSHPALSSESVNGVSGNYAILDQVAALKWVQQNIAQFGGDPDRVTIAGESAGGVNVATLLASPLADGLFKRAIIQSGGFPGKVNLEDNEALGAKIMTLLGVNPSGDTRQILAEMRALGPEEVLLASNTVRGMTRYGPVVDGYVLSAPTMDIYGQEPDQPREVMVGVNANEASLFMPRFYAHKEGGAPGEKEYSQALSLYTGNEERARSLRKLLDTEGDLFRRVERLHTVGWFTCPSQAAARQLASSGHDVYYYYFTRVREGQQTWIGAHHAAEIMYVFDTGNHIFPSNQIDVELSQVMGDYWANFIAKGDPNGNDHPSWPVFKPGAGAYMILGDELSTGENLESAICGALTIPY